MSRIEAFLAANRWRLLDLFQSLDKNKDWKVLRADFVRECERGKIEASAAMIDELLLALGGGDVESNMIDYRALYGERVSHLHDVRRAKLKGKTMAFE